jgi:hypothetical protein
MENTIFYKYMMGVVKMSGIVALLMITGIVVIYMWINRR